MERKLIKQGGSGLTLYVPKRWIDARELQAGDTIQLEEEGDALLLRSTTRGKKSITLSFNARDKAFHYIPAITHVYRLGYDVVTIRVSDTHLLNTIERDVSTLLLGFEVTNRTNDYLVLENISEPAAEKYAVILRRIFFLIQSMGEQIDAFLLQETNKLSLGDLKLRLDKFCFYCKRALTKKIATVEQPLVHWELITYLLAIGHGYYYFGEYLKKHAQKDNALQEYCEKTNTLFSQLHKALYEKNTEIVAQINQQRKDVIFTLPDRLHEQHKTNSAALAKLQHVTRLIQLSSGSIFYLIVD